MLTSVCFTDDMRGWRSVTGRVLHTEDGGTAGSCCARTPAWISRFSRLFHGSEQGLVVGLWSLALRTGDGGEHWTSVKCLRLRGDKAGPTLPDLPAKEPAPCSSPLKWVWSTDP